jgi:hypothetical protein
VNSFQGIYGGSRGDAHPDWLRSGRFAPEAAIGRLLWGMGSFQTSLAGAVSLGLARGSYEFPGILHAIATDLSTEVWARERQVTHASEESEPQVEVNTVTYRTGDFMLSSAQDYRPGHRGDRVHVWQATLGPEQLVFTNHPTSFSESPSRDAGWWCGNGSLPRVAQWKDALIALYSLPEDDWLGFTHAYFPAYAFDEHVVEKGWAFARAGDAYLALCAAQEFELVRRGPDAYRELRSAGLRNAWVCQMGRRDVDSSFENFRRNVLAHKPDVVVSPDGEGPHVVWETLRGDRLEFGWTGPLMLNGQEQPITGFKHHESPYAVADLPCLSMDIGYGPDVMRLRFA